MSASWPVSYTHLDVYKRQEQIYTDLRQLPEEISYFATIVAD